MVLRAFETSLWTARQQRPLTSSEIKWIMKSTILALWTIHRKGLVYTGIFCLDQSWNALICHRREDGEFYGE